MFPLFPKIIKRLKKAASSLGTFTTRRSDCSFLRSSSMFRSEAPTWRHASLILMKEGRIPPALHPAGDGEEETGPPELLEEGTSTAGQEPPVEATLLFLEVMTLNIIKCIMNKSLWNCCVVGWRQEYAAQPGTTGSFQNLMIREGLCSTWTSEIVSLKTDLSSIFTLWSSLFDLPSGDVTAGITSEESLGKWTSRTSESCPLTLVTWSRQAHPDAVQLRRRVNNDDGASAPNLPQLQLDRPSAWLSMFEWKCSMLETRVSDFQVDFLQCCVVCFCSVQIRRLHAGADASSPAAALIVLKHAAPSQLITALARCGAAGRKAPETPELWKSFMVEQNFNTTFRQPARLSKDPQNPGNRNPGEEGSDRSQG